MGRRVSVRLGQSMYEQLQAAAAAGGCAVSDLVRRAVQAFLDDPGAGEPPAPDPLTDPATPPLARAACPPGPPAPPVSEARPRLREAIVPWAEYRRRALQDADGRLPMTHAAAAPGAAPPASTSDAPSRG